MCLVIILNHIRNIAHLRHRQSFEGHAPSNLTLLPLQWLRGLSNQFARSTISELLERRATVIEADFGVDAGYHGV